MTITRPTWRTNQRLLTLLRLPLTKLTKATKAYHILRTLITQLLGSLL